VAERGEEEKMMDGQPTAEEAKGPGAFTVVGVILFVGLGVGLTWWLSSASGPRRNLPAAVIQGELFSAPARRALKAGAETVSAATDAIAALAANTPADEPLPVSFSVLGGFYYEPPDAKAPLPPKERIPASIGKLNHRKISVQGFMVPVRIEKGLTTQFMLVKDQSLCCFGRIPRLNEWIAVTMAGGKPARFIGDRPVTVIGTLEVGEQVARGQVQNIYRLEAEMVAGPVDF
jgi:hypothetical protein